MIGRCIKFFNVIKSEVEFSELFSIDVLLLTVLYYRLYNDPFKKNFFFSRIDESYPRKFLFYFCKPPKKC